MTDAATPAQPRTAAGAIEALARAVASTQPGGGTLDDWEHADAIMRALTEQGYRISHTDPGDTGESRAIEAQARPTVASEGLRAALEALVEALAADSALDADYDATGEALDKAEEQARAALASDAGSVGALDGLDRALLDEHHKEHKQDECWCPCLRIAIAVAYDAERQGEGTLTIPAIQAILDEAQQ